MREIRQSGSEGGVADNGHPYPYPMPRGLPNPVVGVLLIGRQRGLPSNPMPAVGTPWLTPLIRPNSATGIESFSENDSEQSPALASL